VEELEARANFASAAEASISGQAQGPKPPESGPLAPSGRCPGPIRAHRPRSGGRDFDSESGSEDRPGRRRGGLGDSDVQVGFE